jgi:hypothetical protein
MPNNDTAHAVISPRACAVPAPRVPCQCCGGPCWGSCCGATSTPDAAATAAAAAAAAVSECSWLRWGKLQRNLWLERTAAAQTQQQLQHNSMLRKSMTQLVLSQSKYTLNVIQAMICFDPGRQLSEVPSMYLLAGHVT